MSFTVAQQSFSGPLALLLSLIEGKELDITTISLQAVADEYLAYLEQNEVPSDELADFLIVASRLIYLKSRELMPYLRVDDEDVGAAQLEDQLRLYREFVAAAGRLEERYLAFAMYARPFVKQREEAVRFLPARNMSGESMVEAYRTVVKRLEPFFALQEASMERTKSVEERIHELKGALEARASMKFQEVVAGSQKKVEVVVSFLALLELLRRRAIRARQDEHMGDIVIERLDE